MDLETALASINDESLWDLVDYLECQTKITTPPALHALVELTYGCEEMSNAWDIAQEVFGEPVENCKFCPIVHPMIERLKPVVIEWIKTVDWGSEKEAFEQEDDEERERNASEGGTQ